MVDGVHRLRHGWWYTTLLYTVVLNVPTLELIELLQVGIRIVLILY